MFLNRTLIPYFMEFLVSGVDTHLIAFSSSKKEYIFYLKTYFKPIIKRDFSRACFLGNKELVLFFIINGANDWDLGMIHASCGGHKDLVDFFISLRENNWLRSKS